MSEIKSEKKPAAPRKNQSRAAVTRTGPGFILDLTFKLNPGRFYPGKEGFYNPCFV